MAKSTKEQTTIYKSYR